jgi:RNA polymerase sigma-70 factor (ECF subfamily)
VSDSSKKPAPRIAKPLVSDSTLAPVSSCATVAPPPIERARPAVYPRRVDVTGQVSDAARASEDLARALRGSGRVRDEAVAELHALLLRAARFELSRRRAALSHVRGEELEDLAMQAADDALVAVLAKLDDYRGASRFTTWAYKFALLEAGVKVRRRAWQGREVVLASEAWGGFLDSHHSAQADLEQSEMLKALASAIDEALTPHQRDVFVALALNEVPIDVLSERLGTTRGSLYKTLHDARAKLRRELQNHGYAPGSIQTAETA